MSQCRSCHAEIFWVNHPTTGKANPLDDEAVPEGNIRVDFERGTYQVLSGGVLHAAREQGESLWLSHFVTCPYSKMHRKKERS